MKKQIFLNIIILVILLSGFMIPPEDSFAATNGAGYCQVPPYVIQNTPPSIMVVVDNSGSMFNFAYSDGFSTTAITDDRNCSTTSTIIPNADGICTGFLTPGVYPTYKYYGYFDPDYWYTYSSTSGGRFIPAAPKTGSGISGARAKNSTEWDGNFLNWLTMRRTDIIRKVLTGGKVVSTGGGYSRLEAIEADYNSRGAYKKLDLTGYVPDTVDKTGEQCIEFATGGASPSNFTVRTSDNCGSAVVGTYTVQLETPTPVEGVIQSLVGTKARLGLTFYKANTSGYDSATDHGGVVDVEVGGASLSAIVNKINLKAPNSNTPLGETLWTVVGYYAQQASILGGPGPQYSSGDYTINKLYDPFNYGTGGQPRYPTCAKGYILYITDGEPCADGKLPNTLLNYANGKSKFNCGSPGDIDKCPAVAGTAPETFSFPASTFNTCYGGESTQILPKSGYVAGIEDVALYAHTTDLRSATLGVNEINDVQNLTIFPVFAFGKGSTLLRYAAINGGFEDLNANGIPDLQAEWDKNGDGEPDNFYEAIEGYALEQAIKNAFSTMLERASSGTAASVLASGEGSGANLVQAVYYPRRRVGNDIISWAGSIQNLWYYINPANILLSSTREDTDQNRVLNTVSDYIMSLYFDYTAQETRARRCGDINGDGDPDDNDDGICDDPKSTVTFENIASIWEAGSLLWSRDLSADARTIYTHINGSNLISFSTANASTLKPYLDLPTSGDTNLDGFIDGDINHDGSVNNTDAEYLIRYVQGEDGVVVDLNSDGLPEYRSRTVTIGGNTYSWKLGDIVNSTPKISSWLPTSAYHKIYKDSTYGPISDDADVSISLPPNTSHFTTLDTQQNIVDGVNLGAIDGYRRRGMVFVGGNDGMLHAFKLGTLEFAWLPKTYPDKARLTGSNLGKEMWAFMPKNALPYLKYMMDPEYCHVYSVDLTPVIVDVSINRDTGVGQPANCSNTEYWNCNKTTASWRTILIGGMRTGGSCRRTASACTDCVKAPGADTNSDGDKTDPGENLVGLSSYFALDITDQNNPRLLWEFTDEELGFTTTGSAIVKIGARKIVGSFSEVDTTKNGRWFVVLGSGPTGPVSVGDNQFLGRSDQNLKIFVLDLKTGQLLRKTDTGIQNAFASSMFDSGQDFTQKPSDYQDDAVYIGYTKKCTATNNICTNNTWTNGGVLRLFTKKNLNGIDLSVTGSTAINPNNWAASTVIDGVGPVTAGVKRLQKVQDTTNNGGISWLYFTTGRYFYVQGSDVDDPDKTRAIFGLKEPCFSLSGLNANCTTQSSFCTSPCSNPTATPRCSSPATCGDFVNVSNPSNAVSDPDNSGYKGWFINLHPLDNYTYAEGSPPVNVTKGYKIERSITDPTVTGQGCVIFVTLKPYSDECSIGGKSFLRTVWYETGGFVPAGINCGIVILQLSTGSIENVPADQWLSSALEGIGSGPPPPVIGPAKPRQRIFQTKER